MCINKICIKLLIRWNEEYKICLCFIQFLLLTTYNVYVFIFGSFLIFNFIKWNTKVPFQFLFLANIFMLMHHTYLIFYCLYCIVYCWCIRTIKTFMYNNILFSFKCLLIHFYLYIFWLKFPF